MSSALEFCVRVKTVDNLGSKWDRQPVYIEVFDDKKVILGKTSHQSPLKGAVSWPDTGDDSGIMCMTFAAGSVTVKLPYIV
jgi:hypothetical protein